ncbi:MAG: hypothetical protein FWG66_10140 [Spirochaetes bacterium]|nr:hypothetical protein [Spirochaetota bacterium]
MSIPWLFGEVVDAAKDLVRLIKKAKRGPRYYIQNNGGLFFSGMVDKRFLFFKYRSAQWVSDESDGMEFENKQEASYCIQENKLSGARVVEETFDEYTG